MPLSPCFPSTETVKALLSAQQQLLDQNQQLITQQGALINKLCSVLPGTWEQDRLYEEVPDVALGDVQ